MQMTRYCANCGYQNREQNSLCAVCGMQLETFGESPSSGLQEQKNFRVPAVKGLKKIRMWAIISIATFGITLALEIVYFRILGLFRVRPSGNRRS